MVVKSKSVKKKGTPNKRPMVAIRPKPTDDFDIDAVVEGKDGKPKPSLQEAVEHLYYRISRSSMIRRLGFKYGVKASTIDKCVARIKDEATAYMALSREERIKGSVKFLEAVRIDALASRQHGAAARATETLHKLAGDHVDALDIRMPVDAKEGMERAEKLRLKALEAAKAARAKDK